VAQKVVRVVRRVGKVIEPVPGETLIERERDRQRFVEGWTPEHDEQHDRGELGQAGACYLHLVMGSLGSGAADADQSSAREPAEWPWDSEWWKPKTRLRNLIRGGALIQAEIDRLQRLKNQAVREIDVLTQINNQRAEP